MSKANLLNTHTTEFMQLVGNGKTFRVPRYQRDYSWEEEQWEDLWSDILELRGRAGDRHYMGAIVVEATNDREFKIIDGQQRIATLSILVLAVIQRLRQLADQGIDAERNRERAQQLRNRFIGEKDPASLVESSKLTLNATDDDFYQDYLVALREPRNPRGLPRSCRQIWSCFQYFSARIAEPPALRDDGEQLALLVSEVVARQLLFIHISVDDELSAYTVFETLNARGLELSATDLLKNYLFSRVKVAADLDAMQRRWARLIATVGQERFPEFLRYHLLCEEPKIRSQRLFKIVRERVRDGTGAFALIESLEARGDVFAALSDPAHGLWADRSGCRPFVRALNTFRVRQMTPLLFAAWERLDATTFESVMRLVYVISFRYSIVSGLNTNALEPVYHRAAKAVLDRTARSAEDVFEHLKSVYVRDEDFRRDFARLAIDSNGQRKRVVRLILAQLEADVAGHAIDPETDPFTIEHVLPENPSDGWEAAFPRDQWDAAIYRIGNLVPLEVALNRNVGSADYTTKAAAYPRSVYRLAKDLVGIAPSEWTPALLEARQVRLAQRAAHIWRVPFPA